MEDELTKDVHHGEYKRRTFRADGEAIADADGLRNDSAEIEISTTENPTVLGLEYLENETYSLQR